MNHEARITEELPLLYHFWVHFVVISEESIEVLGDGFLMELSKYSHVFFCVEFEEA